MRLWRRRQPEPVAAHDTSILTPTTSPLPAIRLERAVVALASHAAQLADRVDRLERRLEDAEDTAFAALSPGAIDSLARRVEGMRLEAAGAEEVLELRLHTTRLSSELTRVAIELRSEIDRLASATDEQRDRTRRLESMASVIELGDGGDHWAASALTDLT